MTKRFSRLETASVLSVIIPVYNEAQTIGRILQQVVGAVPETPKQIVIVDDSSTEGTSEWLRRNLAHSDGIWCQMSLNDKGDLALSANGLQNQGEFWFTVLFHEHNRGKGAALRTGFSFVSGDVIVIQDADLEYYPGDWAQMLNGVADVVYGSRFYGRPHRSLYFHHYIGNRLISFFLTFSIIRCCPTSRSATRCSPVRC